jgi:hypothetical protein
VGLYLLFAAILPFSAARLILGHFRAVSGHTFVGATRCRRISVAKYSAQEVDPFNIIRASANLASAATRLWVEWNVKARGFAAKSESPMFSGVDDAWSGAAIAEYWRVSRHPRHLLPFRDRSCGRRKAARSDSSVAGHCSI